MEAYRPGQRRTVTRTSGGGGVQVQYTNRGHERRTKEATAQGAATIAAPTCSLAALWAQALAAGAPASAVATIEYSRDGYRFAITGTTVNLAFGTDCQPKAR